MVIEEKGSTPKLDRLSVEIPRPIQRLPIAVKKYSFVFISIFLYTALIYHIYNI